MLSKCPFDSIVHSLSWINTHYILYHIGSFSFSVVNSQLWSVNLSKEWSTQIPHRHETIKLLKHCLCCHLVACCESNLSDQFLLHLVKNASDPQTNPTYYSKPLEFRLHGFTWTDYIRLCAITVLQKDYTSNATATVAIMSMDIQYSLDGIRWSICPGLG